MQPHFILASTCVQEEECMMKLPPVVISAGQRIEKEQEREQVKIKIEERRDV